MSREILLAICILIFNSISLISQDLKYGLEFSSFEVVQEKRTSLDLSPHNNFSFPNGFSLSFNLFFQSAPQLNYGYVFRIIGQNDKHLDFLSTPEKLTVVNSDDNVLAECMISETSNNFTSFFPFKCSMDIKNNTLTIIIGEKVFSHKDSSLLYFKDVNIIFGKCNHPQFQTSDVPKMIIKEIHINDIKGDEILYWILSKHVEDGVYDELKNHFAKVENPRWMLDDYAFWNKKISFKTLKNPQITYNPDKKVIAIADRRSFFEYNTVSDDLIQYNISSGSVHSDQPNQMIYNPVDHLYYSYCFVNNEGRDLASYDFSKKSWNNNNITELESEFWHHNRFVSVDDDCLYLFGGYGQHKYKNQVSKFSLKTEKWEMLKYQSDQIYPRYLSGLGVVDKNNIIIFGGYGNNSGFQFLSPKNYYDLYQINIPELTVNKIWEMEPPKNQFVVANSMIVDTLNNCFYALCFPQNQYETSLFLAKFSLLKPEYEIVSNNIPFYFNDVLSFADLYQDSETKEFYTVTFSSFLSDSLATVSIYSLSYPPLLLNTSVNQIINNNNDNDFHYLLIGIIFLLLIFVLIIYRHVKKKKFATENTNEYSDNFTDEGLKEKKPVNTKNKKQAILLFGGFKINDKNGNDITSEFSPMLKQLFLIILLYSLSDERRGISSTKLNETLWPNKTPESARNNRSVMISKIRQLFDNVGNFNIDSFNSNWTIQLGDEIYCDYHEALLLMKYMETKNHRTKENVMKLLNIISFGELLPNLQTEWIDSFKASFANELIDLLIDLSKQKEVTFSTFEIIRLADTLFTYDILNDDALKLKCCALVKMGKNGLARETYNSFVKQYSILFGDKYNYTFIQVIS